MANLKTTVQDGVMVLRRDPSPDIPGGGTSYSTSTQDVPQLIPGRVAPRLPPALNPDEAPSGSRPTEMLNELPLFKRWALGAGVFGLTPRKNMAELLGSYRSWIYNCVRVRGQRVASLPLSLVLNERQQSSADVTRTELYDHPFLNMMWAPNPFTTRFELWTTTMNHLDLTGNAYWLILKDKLTIPREIWPLYPQYMRIVPDITGFVSGYIYTASSPFLKFDVNTPEYQVIHFKYPNPLSPYYGMGPLEAQAMAFDIDLYMQVYQRAFFSEGARPDFVMETEQIITKETAELIWELWDDRHKGPTKAYRPGILGSGLKAHPLNVSNRDLAFATLAEFTRDQILGAYGVPAAKLGLVADFNRANSDGADYTFNKETILPVTILIEERVEKDVLPAYQGQDETVWLETDFDEVVPRDQELEIKDRESKLKTGQRVINEYREEDGHPPVKWGDLPIQPSINVPYDGTKPDPMVPELPAPSPGAPADPAVPAVPEDGTPTDGKKPKKKPKPEDTTDGGQDGGSGGDPEATDDAGKAELRDSAAYDREVEAWKVREWTDFVRAVSPHEEEFVGDWQERFHHQEQRVVHIVVDRLKAMDIFFTGWGTKKVLAALVDPAKYRAPDFIAQILHSLDADTDTWTEQTRNALEEVVDETGETAVAKIDVGTWDLQDPIAQEWLRQYSSTEIKNVQETTKQAIRDTLTQGVEAGEGAAQQAKRVQAVFGEASKVRAMRIARTETHTAANFGKSAGWAQTGVVGGKVWLGAKDSRERETHLAAEGQEQPLNGNFKVGKGSGPAPGQIGLPEEDINCFPGETVVEGRIVGGLKAFYSGGARELVTRRGYRLTVTPNHPILTPTGWVQARLLHEGMNLLSHREQLEGSLLDHKDDQHRPPTAKQVFQTLATDSGIRLTMVKPHDLHGDALRTDGEVDIVGANSKLVTEVGRGIQGGQHDQQVDLVAARWAGSPTEQGRRRTEFLDGLADAPTVSSPSPTTLTLDRPAIQLESAPLQGLRCGPVADWHTTLGEASKQQRAAVPAFVTELLEASAGDIAPDELVEIRDIQFDGHVFDLQAVDGWILAQGICISNCRCTMNAVLTNGTTPGKPSPPPIVTTPGKPKPIIVPSPPQPAPTAAPVNTWKQMKEFMTGQTTVVKELVGQTVHMGDNWNTRIAGMDKFIKATMGGADPKVLKRRIQVNTHPDAYTPAENKKLLDQSQQVRERLAEILSPDVVKTQARQSCLMDFVRQSEKDPWGRRGDYVRSDKLCKISQRDWLGMPVWAKASDAEIVKTGIHEYAHHLEYSISGLRRRANMFLKARTRGEKVVEMNSIPGYEHYETGERTLKDRWYNAYMGRVYLHKATEICTMIMQEFRTPVEALWLYEKDPESFAFGWTFMTGRKFEIPLR